MESFIKMEKIKLPLSCSIFFLCSLLFLISCSSDIDKEEELISNKYQLEEFYEKTNLTPFVANHAIYNMSVIKTSPNKFKISTESYDLLNVNNRLKNNFYILVLENAVQLQTTVDNKIYKLIKNDSKKETSFQVNDQIFFINESFFDSITKQDEVVFDKLVSIFIELYDKNAKRLSPYITSKVATSIAIKSASSCLKFESAIGATASASKLRASADTQEYISDGNSDCRIVGSDTSCVLDNHVCVTTVTMSCSSSCNWWN